MPDKNKPNPAAGSDPGSDKNLSRLAAGSNPGSDKNLSRPAAGSIPTTAFHPGDLLLDTYRVESEAFQGGMGSTPVICFSTPTASNPKPFKGEWGPYGVCIIPDGTWTSR